MSVYFDFPKRKLLLSLLNIGSYMSALVLFNLLNECGKRIKNARLAEYFISFSQRV